MKKSLVKVPMERVENAILLVRGEKVIMDSDLAKLYGVTTARLNQQVKRNSYRFPDDFMFQLTRQEYSSLMLQIATSKARGGRRKLPSVFTEHGAIMAANVLSSKSAVLREDPSLTVGFLPLNSATWLRLGSGFRFAILCHSPFCIVE